MKEDGRKKKCIIVWGGNNQLPYTFYIYPLIFLKKMV
jgi:hypothetical protein